MIPLVTACNADYIPGALALVKTARRLCHPSLFPVVLFDGTNEEAAPLRELDARVVMNPQLPDADYKPTTNRPEETARVHYFRTLIPELFKEYPRAIWIDSDSIVLRDLLPLAQLNMHQPIAASRDRAPLSKQWKGAPNGHGFISSLIVFDLVLWRRHGMSERLRDAMTRSADFYTSDQAALNITAQGRWQELPKDAQAHVGHGWDDPRVLHFLGTKPWQPIPEKFKPYPAHKMRARALWHECSQS